MSLLLPPNVEAEIAKEKNVAARAKQRARLDVLLDFDDPVCKEWSDILARFDRYLSIGRALPMAYAPELAIRPGFYHWVRDNGPATPMTVTPITGPDDEWTEPDGSLLRRLQSSDLQNPAVFRAIIAERAIAERAYEQQLADEKEQRVSLALDHIKAAQDVSVSMSSRWSQNVAGKKSRL